MIVLAADPGTSTGSRSAGSQSPGSRSLASRTPVGLTHRLKMQLGPAGWIATAYHDPHLAFAELCLRERAQASRAAWGLQRVEKLAMVIVDPMRWPGVADLVAAIKRYTPSVAIWTYRDGSLQAIAHPRPQKSDAADHAMTVMDIDSDEQEWTGEVQTMPMPEVSHAPAPSPAQAGSLRDSGRAAFAKPSLRLAGVDDQPDHPSAAAQGEGQSDAAANGNVPTGGASSTPSVVTREEIDLLLQRNPGLHSPGPGASSSGAPA